MKWKWGRQAFCLQHAQKKAWRHEDTSCLFTLKILVIKKKDVRLQHQRLKENVIEKILISVIEIFLNTKEGLILEEQGAYMES